MTTNVFYADVALCSHWNMMLRREDPPITDPTKCGWYWTDEDGETDGPYDTQEEAQATLDRYNEIKKSLLVNSKGML